MRISSYFSVVVVVWSLLMFGIGFIVFAKLFRTEIRHSWADGGDLQITDLLQPVHKIWVSWRADKTSSPGQSGSQELSPAVLQGGEGGETGVGRARHVLY